MAPPAPLGTTPLYIKLGLPLAPAIEFKELLQLSNRHFVKSVICFVAVVVRQSSGSPQAVVNQSSVSRHLFRSHSTSKIIYPKHCKH